MPPHHTYRDSDGNTLTAENGRLTLDIAGTEVGGVTTPQGTDALTLARALLDHAGLTYQLTTNQ
ncbi:hypothetical protein [Nocardiopsis sp. LOL_012]|uniref:hypothetical protein n=1 Tax=Nocardiopsis sp. LOL_012 TaxID=3345409 RepID=UPI003A898BA5